MSGTVGHILAQRRAMVHTPHGIAVLLYWPRNGHRARVMIPDGRRYEVSTDDITFNVDDVRAVIRAGEMAAIRRGRRHPNDRSTTLGDGLGNRVERLPNPDPTEPTRRAQHGG